MKGYARRAEKILHLVLSKTMDMVEWKTTRITRDVEEIRKLKQQPGKDMMVIRRRCSGIQSDESGLGR
jgi:hypothetical protein